MQLEDIMKNTHITVPALEIQKVGDTAIVRNDVLGTRFEGSQKILDVLDEFRSPKSLKDALETAKFEPQDIMIAVMNAFLMDVDLLVPNVDPHIGKKVKLSEFLKFEKAPDVAIFGSIVDSAASGRAGCRHGPSEIRFFTRLPLFESPEDQLANPFQLKLATSDRVFLDYETRRQYQGSPPEVVDLGIVGAIFGESINTYGARIKMLSELVLEKGAAPAMLGGDHSSTWFVLDALLKKHESLGIIHFDAHHDVWQPFAPQFDYLTHGNPFANALKSSHLKRLHQLGLRILESQYASKLKEDNRVSYLSARELQRLQPKEVFNSLPRDIPYYLSFDIDCIDPLAAPETGTPVPGGLSYYQAVDLVAYAARKFQLVGWDIVEVGQREGRINKAALCAAGLIRQLILAPMEFVPMTTYCREA